MEPQWSGNCEKQRTGRKEALVGPDQLTSHVTLGMSFCFSPSSTEWRQDPGPLVSSLLFSFICTAINKEETFTAFERDY